MNTTDGISHRSENLEYHRSMVVVLGPKICFNSHKSSPSLYLYFLGMLSLLSLMLHDEKESALGVYPNRYLVSDKSNLLKRLLEMP